MADGRLYEVRLVVVGEGQLAIHCNCAQFRAGHGCQHVWASVLKADQDGALSDLAAGHTLKVAGGGGAPARPLPYYEPPAPAAGKPQPPPWLDQLSSVRRKIEEARTEPHAWPQGFELLYVIDVPGSKQAGAIVLDLFSHSRKKGGEFKKYKEFRLAPARIASLPDPLDRDILTMLFGGVEPYSYSYSYGSKYGSTMTATPRKALPAPLAQKLIPLISGAGRLAISSDYSSNNMKEAVWDAGGAWKFVLEVRQDERDQWNITGTLRRGTESMPVTEPLLLLESGMLLTEKTVSAFDPQGGFAWVEELRSAKRIPFPDRERDAVLANLLESPHLPPMELDEPLRYEERRLAPKTALRITQKRDWNGQFFDARLLWDYGRGWMPDSGRKGGIWLPEEKLYVVRDEPAEDAAREELRQLGLKPGGDGPWRLQHRTMPRAVRELIQKGWHVEAEGRAFRRPGQTRVDVRSGIDWFELHGEVDYDGMSASLPQLLAALRRGDTMIPLGDGSFGLLPEEWLERFAPLAGLGSAEKDHLRFRQNQAGLLDALLAAQPDVHMDELFAQARERLCGFRGVGALEQPAGFRGQLRDYQREGLGWLEFLRDFGFGGCLADDMGVGKTAQVLAAVESRCREHGPSLVVAPKSLMFNWREEAARFTPNLRVLVHTGTARDLARVSENDLILTTYGTLLRDAPELAEMEFDYVVLDEAQAVKNASTASAKAVRLLRGKHRLALSGTPVENHLGELWSLFEFLNPGMLGEAKVLRMAGGLGRNPGPEARQLLAQALRPFILRRTKQQVARELPPKTEQTIYCELDSEQRKFYDELRAHYRHSLLDQVQSHGLAKSKMHVLEALLRLRQAACHPALLDAKQPIDASAKVETLLDRLDELREEGHKALVFSQFTSLLAIVRKRLDESGVRYEYLDGATRDRKAPVDNFQNDPECGLFLISLKAGGLGLNLTAAEYVFLLDPWWNPAVEAQAVDRAHRIGQTRPVFAYRLIARDTVEEKVLELQKTKRDLADAILGEDNSLIRDLKKEDLDLLLS